MISWIHEHPYMTFFIALVAINAVSECIQCIYKATLDYQLRKIAKKIKEKS